MNDILECMTDDFTWNHEFSSLELFYSNEKYRFSSDEQEEIDFVFDFFHTAATYVPYQRY